MKEFNIQLRIFVDVYKRLVPCEFGGEVYGLLALAGECQRDSLGLLGRRSVFVLNRSVVAVGSGQHSRVLTCDLEDAECILLQLLNKLLI